MTLFDNQPLTEEESAARDLCACGHTRGEHTNRQWQCVVCLGTHTAPELELATVVCRCGVGAGRWAVASGCASCACESFTPETAQQ